MTRDFKQNETATQSGQYGISWVLGGIAVGLLAGAVVYALMSKPELVDLSFLSGNQTQQNNQLQTSPAPTTSALATEQQQNPATLEDKPQEDNRPGFSYHAVLPQLELDIPITVPQETAPTNAQQLPRVEEQAVATQQDTQVVNNQSQYMFQLGAYRNKNQAIQMQRRARQNGMNTRVEPANINGQTWYRVRLGPTDNLQIVNRWKQRLSGMGINPMMIRL